MKRLINWLVLGLIVAALITDGYVAYNLGVGLYSIFLGYSLAPLVAGLGAVAAALLVFRVLAQGTVALGSLYYIIQDRF